MEQSRHFHFGPYRVLGQIGSGGMGAVYRARDQRLERDVAVKVLHQHLEISGARERFLREARAVSSLNHPNICTVFDIGEQDGEPFLVMELLEGESLKERLLDGREITPAELEAIATQAANALAAAHAKGIIHRDIKPANLFLVSNPEGEVQLKVLDFGLAKLESDRLLHGDSGGLTRTGSTVGTVEYMSPEQARGLELDPRSDLFSLGAVMYELATGDVPFRGATSAVVFAELLGSDPAPARESNTKVSPGLDRIIHHLLEKRREARTQSAAALLAELRDLRKQAAAKPGSTGGGVASTTTPAVPPLMITPASAAEKPLAPPVTEAPAAPLPPPSKGTSSSQDRRSKTSVELPVIDPVGRSVRSRTSSATRASMVTAREPGGQAEGTKPVLSGAGSSQPEAAKDSAAVSRSRVFPSVAVLVVLLASVGGFLYWRSAKSVAVAAVTGALQVTQFANTTGDEVLQDTPAVALQILLGEAPVIQLRGYAPPSADAQETPQAFAKRSGADAYLTGTVSRDGERYRVHAEILQTSDGSRLAAEDADAPSLLEMSAALSRLAIALRSHLGETPEQANANTIPLNIEAGDSLAALALYGRGLGELRAGHEVAAVEHFSQSLKSDPTSAVARLGLAEALRASGAETERLRAVAPLRDRGDKGSVCERTDVAYELAAPGATALDAAQHWVNACPAQVSAQIATSRELLNAGRAAESDAAAARATSLDPLGGQAHNAATLAMLAQDHFESALKEQQKAQAAQVSSPGLTLLAAYLRGDDEAEAQAATAAAAAPGWTDQWNYVTYLSNRGRLDEASRFGEAAATRLSASPSVTSAGLLMRERLSALRAMAGHCDVAVPVAGDASEQAQFYHAIAASWCHRATPTDLHLQDAAVLTVVRGAASWGAGDAQSALNILQGARSSAVSPIAAMIRGEAHLALKQEELAIGDYRAIITRHGSAVLTGTLVYPAAQAGLATTYHFMGDNPNSTRIQADLKLLWKDAAAAEPLLHRATR